MGSTSAGEQQYTVKRAPSSGGAFYVVVDAEGNEPSSFGHALERDAQREADQLNGATEQRRLAVRCSDGCGYTGRRLHPGLEKPCPRCGAPVDVGIPTRPAMRTKQGGIGGRTQLIWGPWS